MPALRRLIIGKSPAIRLGLRGFSLQARVEIVARFGLRGAILPAWLVAPLRSGAMRGVDEQETTLLSDQLSVDRRLDPGGPPAEVDHSSGSQPICLFGPSRSGRDDALSRFMRRRGVVVARSGEFPRGCEAALCLRSIRLERGAPGRGLSHAPVYRRVDSFAQCDRADENPRLM